MNLTEIKAILAERGFSPLKQLGQNFLHEQALAQGLVKQALEGVPPEATVVEIGPGLASLTDPLLAAMQERSPNSRLIVLERDRGLSEFLRQRFASQITAGTFELREGDALDFIPAMTEKPALICGNLPYYISTPLLMESMKKATATGAAPRLFFVVQREVGQRLASRQDGKEYGALSVLIQVSYQVKIVRMLTGQVFYPAPEVSSAAVELTPLAKPLVTPEERPRFTAVVQRGFSQRRKKLSNLLPTKDGRRAEHLSPSEWVALWREVEAARLP